MIYFAGWVAQSCIYGWEGLVYYFLWGVSYGGFEALSGLVIIIDMLLNDLRWLHWRQFLIEDSIEFHATPTRRRINWLVVDELYLTTVDFEREIGRGRIVLGIEVPAGTELLRHLVLLVLYPMLNLAQVFGLIIIHIPAMLRAYSLMDLVWTREILRILQAQWRVRKAFFESKLTRFLGLLISKLRIRILSKLFLFLTNVFPADGVRELCFWASLSTGWLVEFLRLFDVHRTDRIPIIKSHSVGIRGLWWIVNVLVCVLTNTTSLALHRRTSAIILWSRHKILHIPPFLVTNGCTLTALAVDVSITSLRTTSMIVVVESHLAIPIRQLFMPVNDIFQKWSRCLWALPTEWWQLCHLIYLHGLLFLF